MASVTGSMCIDSNGLILSADGDLKTDNRELVAGKYMQMFRAAKVVGKAEEDPVIYVETSDSCVVVKSEGAQIVVVKSSR